MEAALYILVFCLLVAVLYGPIMYRTDKACKEYPAQKRINKPIQPVVTLCDRKGREVNRKFIEK